MRKLPKAQCYQRVSACRQIYLLPYYINGYLQKVVTYIDGCTRRRIFFQQLKESSGSLCILIHLQSAGSPLMGTSPCFLPSLHPYEILQVLLIFSLMNLVGFIQVAT